MKESTNYSGLINHAQLGNQESMSRLAELARERLFAYIYRLTLNHDLTQDLLQETLMEMVKSLKNLEHPDRFWYWLFRTALGKVQHYFRDQGHRRLVQLSAIERERLLERTQADYNDGLGKLARKELSDAVFEAMRKLKLKYRNILILRCYEQMSYSEIAVLMNSNELQVRVLFLRAKNSLKKRLARRGFSQKFLLTGLALFGLITAPAKAASAASTVSAASVEVGMIATVIGSLFGKVGVVLATVFSAVTLAVSIKAFFCVLAIVCVTFLCLFLVYLASVYSS